MMNAIERRALYHLLRMNWLNDPNLSVASWQVEDYRSLPLIDLFKRLERFEIRLNRLSFVSHADECGSPEELTDHLIGEETLSPMMEDQVYLLIFELWRRLMSEKPSLSIICNEFDYQIYLYDHEKTEDLFALQDAITNFLKILDENVDQGISPQNAFQLICNYCGNDIEMFLYDFIGMQIDEGNEGYAYELLTSFDPYLKNDKWFKLLHLHLVGQTQNNIAQKIIGEMIEEGFLDEDLDYILELLSTIADMDDRTTFRMVLKHAVPWIKVEEDFQELLSIVIDYFHHLGETDQEENIKLLLDHRLQYPLNKAIHHDDVGFIHLLRIFDLIN